MNSQKCIICNEGPNAGFLSGKRELTSDTVFAVVGQTSSEFKVYPTHTTGARIEGVDAPQPLSARAQLIEGPMHKGCNPNYRKHEFYTDKNWRGLSELVKRAYEQHLLHDGESLHITTSGRGFRR